MSDEPDWLHGEYKTPGGKLVAVDLAVADGVLRAVVVSGDFFLYPEEALGAIAGSLDGVAAGSSDAELTSRIAAPIPPGTEWLGSSPEGLMIAVRRALDAGEQDAGELDGGEIHE